jgi:hypothetical protein
MPKCPEGQKFDKVLEKCRDIKKVGRPSLKKKCPEGQVYDNTLQDCRDKKNVGRPPKKSKSPKEKVKEEEEEEKEEEEEEIKSESSSESEIEEEEAPKSEDDLRKRLEEVHLLFFIDVYDEAVKTFGGPEEDKSGIVNQVWDTVKYINTLTENSLS